MIIYILFVLFILTSVTHDSNVYKRKRDRHTETETEPDQREGENEGGVGTKRIKRGSSGGGNREGEKGGESGRELLFFGSCYPRGVSVAPSCRRTFKTYFTHETKTPEAELLTSSVWRM